MEDWFCGGLLSPKTARKRACNSFNVGVEAGQLAFVLAVLGARLLLRHVPARYPRWVTGAPVYTMGSLAAFWCFERATALFR